MKITLTIMPSFDMDRHITVDFRTNYENHITIMNDEYNTHVYKHIWAIDSLNANSADVKICKRNIKDRSAGNEWLTIKSIALNKNSASALFDIVKSIQLSPVFPADSLDGTTYKLNVGNGEGSIEIYYNTDVPDTWSGVSELVSALEKLITDNSEPQEFSIISKSSPV
ncbi:MAG: hypothetical protein KZQ83_00525 [gamma proteobacterium symbiont of Taylorina sp.]|nr:hypothetical protein [gamma proteobacterium symbiont of Taylorina sp.]